MVGCGGRYGGLWMPLWWVVEAVMVGCESRYGRLFPIILSSFCGLASVLTCKFMSHVMLLFALLFKIFSRAVRDLCLQLTRVAELVPFIRGVLVVVC